ncbi:MAG: saccharopine dehydrogenase C-terminal domain-containing protein [Acidimicrobiales bacterium]
MTRLLILGAGGVGSAAARTIDRWALFERVVVADYSRERAERAIVGLGDRFSAVSLDANDESSIVELVDTERLTAVLNAVDPRFVMPIFRASLASAVTYLDMAMSLSKPDPSDPYHNCGVKLGDEQFALADQWEDKGALALCGVGVEPGMSDVFARYAADEQFSSIDEIGVRDGANLSVSGYDFAPTFSIWTTIEECLNPPVIFDRERGWYTTAPFSQPETFDFPGGIGPLECVNVEHEEVVLIPRWIDAGRVTFKYGLGEEFIDILKSLHKLGLDSTERVRVGGVEVSPRDVVAACLPDPATLGQQMSGVTCAGTWVRGTGKDGLSRSVYLYHLVDNSWSMKEYGSQAVVWQTAVNPVIALELLESGAWSGVGVLGPEAFPPKPFLERLVEHGTPWAFDERASVASV